MSEETKRRISQSQKQRWAQQKSVASRCPDFLRTVRRQSPEPTVSLCQRFLASGNDALALAVAQTYSYNGWPSPPTPDERQIFESLLSHTNAQVRAEAVSILRIVAQTDVPRALDLMMNVEISSEAELPEKLFETFSKHGGIPFSVLTPEQITVLLNKLRDLTSLKGHHIGRFLSDALLVDPLSVTQLLLQRLEQKNRLEMAQWETEDKADRAILRERAKSYAALPQHGWREDKSEKWELLPNHPDYRAALRLVRDAIVEEAPMQYEDTIAELFRDLSLGYNEIGLEILNGWVDSGDAEKLYEVTGLLDCTFAEFYFSRPDGTEQVLQAAKIHGSEVFEKVERVLMHHAIYGPKRGECQTWSSCFSSGICVPL